MTENEIFMYRLMERLSEAEIPLVFKGGLITKLIFEENNFREIERMTKDIDANLESQTLSADTLIEVINEALDVFDGKYLATMKRVPAKHQSLGIKVIEKESGDTVVTMDIDIKPVLDSKIYYIDDRGIKGVLPDEILVDKISVLSSRFIFRRAKDLIDVYGLTQCVEVNTDRILKLSEKMERHIGDFSAFLTMNTELEHAYHMLAEVRGKPSFNEVYTYLKDFLKPFIAKEYEVNRIWQSDQRVWGNLPVRSKVQTKKGSVEKSKTVKRIHRL